MLFLIAATPVAFAQQGPAELWIWDDFDSVVDGNSIRELNETVPSAGITVVGEPLANAPEIEFGNGNFYNSSNSGLLEVIDATSGLITEALTLNFGASSNSVITAMEFVGETLFGGASQRSGAPSELVTVDLSTGTVTAVGLTGVSGPLGGLAYNGTMYAIQSGGADPTDLFTVDLTTGTATSVGSTGVQLTGLEFGADGLLYALGRSSNEDTLLTLAIRLTRFDTPA